MIAAPAPAGSPAAQREGGAHDAVAVREGLSQHLGLEAPDVGLVGV